MEAEIQAQIPNIDHVLSDYSVVSEHPVQRFNPKRSSVYREGQILLQVQSLKERIPH